MRNLVFSLFFFGAVKKQKWYLSDSLPFFDQIDTIWGVGEGEGKVDGLIIIYTIYTIYSGGEASYCIYGCKLLR